jgi:hypothetical protein
VALKINSKKFAKRLNKLIDTKAVPARVTLWQNVKGDQITGGKDEFMLMADEKPLVYTSTLEEMQFIFDFEKGLFKAGVLNLHRT